ncbi:hypothetical protein T265_08371 [Opisthorchis viverrini]|uniref:Myotubularin phosphatase domain-containing protein n=1 Tax=Opisthorchis viverrini TaxID=6198 RepID=A0A074ZKD7_OPIVI|nr:hypothetical protein T265_08371 [Opisthorchis viverrini]KER23825.1 hypothetical protein T265_08371 [Opisthorchis viverrini]
MCAHYPPALLLPELDDNCSTEDLQKLISQAKFARSRTRFVCPVLSFGRKVVCRSSTLSGSLELYGRQFASVAGFNFDTTSGLPQVPNNARNSNPVGVHEVQSTLDHFRDNDCELLKRFRVAYICDFMLEYRKMKYRLPVTSSEKADSHRRYHDFDVLALPYPGSEFFRVWRDSEYAMTDLVFDWEQAGIEVELREESLRGTLLTSGIDWTAYKTWDVTTLTGNYLKLLLGLLVEGAGGMLLHCVSGWDRTPLFISLMRCVLWAEQLAHQSLGASEMLYFTLAYDWFLFGHKLRTRLESGEEILLFAFRFLATIASDTSFSLRDVYGVHLTLATLDKSSNFIGFDYRRISTMVYSTFQRSDIPRELKCSPIERRHRLEQLSTIFQITWENALEMYNPLGRPVDTLPNRTQLSGSWVVPLGETPEDDRTAKYSPLSMVSQISSVVTSAAAMAYELAKPLLGERADTEASSSVQPGSRSEDPPDI